MLVLQPNYESEATRTVSRIEKLRESVHRRKHKLSELPVVMCRRVLARLAEMVERWEQEHGRRCPQRIRAILTGIAIRVELDPNLARRQAGQKSYRVRCERYGEDAVGRHMKNISPKGVLARRCKNLDGRHAPEEKARAAQPAPGQTAEEFMYGIKPNTRKGWTW